MTSRERDTAFGLMVAFAVCAAALVAYANTLTAGFVWDDVSSVLLHEHVQDPSQFTQLFREDQHAFGRGQGNFYRPLVAASFMLDYAIAGPGPGVVDPATGMPDVSPFLFHLVNVLWHIAASLLLFALMTRLDAPRAVRAAVPLLYAVHPLHTEAVAYISGRADPMAAAFMFAALLCALWRGSAIRQGVGAALSALFFVCALLSKESAAVYPFLLLLVVAFEPLIDNVRPLRTAYLRRTAALVLAVVIVTAYTWLRSTFLDFAPPQSGASTSFGERLVQVGQAFAYYIRLIFVPTGLQMERTLDGVPGWVAPVGYLLLAGCVALAIAAIRRGRHRIALAMGWFLVTWFPISGLIPLNAPMAEHWMYVPLAGFLWALAEVVWARPRTDASRQLLAVAVYALVLLFVVAAVTRNRDWKSNETIYTATIKANPDSLKAQYNLAVTYEVLENNPAGARRHYEQVLAIYDKMRRDSGQNTIWDQEIEARVSLGNMALEQGDYPQALSQFSAALQATPGENTQKTLASAFYGRGRALLGMGETNAAVQDFQRAIQQRPELRPEITRLLRNSFMMGTA